MLSTRVSEVRGLSLNTSSVINALFVLLFYLGLYREQFQTANFTKPTHGEFSSHPSYQYIQINLQENLLKSLLVSLFTAGIRRSIPNELWDTYLVSSQNMEYVMTLFVRSLTLN